MNHQISSAISASSGIIKDNFFNISFSAGDNQPSVYLQRRPDVSAGPGGPATAGFRPPESCLKEFTPLRDETASRAKLIKAATERRFAPGEACQLVHEYELAQTKMIDYAVAHASTCGIPPKITDQLKANHENTLAVMRKVCTAT